VRLVFAGIGVTVAVDGRRILDECGLLRDPDPDDGDDPRDTAVTPVELCAQVARGVAVFSVRWRELPL